MNKLKYAGLKFTIGVFVILFHEARTSLIGDLPPPLEKRWKETFWIELFFSTVDETVIHGREISAKEVVDE